MDITTLEKANKLNQKIKDLQRALNCFEWEDGGGSTNPNLIIEFDGEDGRETQRIPMELNIAIVSYIKREIVRERDAAVAEFNFL